MKITVNFTVHIYAEERLCDELLIPHSENNKEKFIGIYNFSENDKVAWINEEDGMYTDLISGREMEARGVQIPAFGCYWLCRNKQ